MKKISKKQITRDIRRNLAHRRVKNKKKRKYKKQIRKIKEDYHCKNINKWIEKQDKSGNISIAFENHRKIIIYLPEEMNFSDKYDSTILHIVAIRKLVVQNKKNHKVYKLASVNFDSLKKISTSAALVLTAELSKWDDRIKHRLHPVVDKWDKNIFAQLFDLGYFDLFTKKPNLHRDTINSDSSSLKLVKYIKGKCGDVKETRKLRERIQIIIGNEVQKWTFLRSGLDEAITNVSHHAYPSSYGFSGKDKYWYLTGSYDELKKELKIVFYDQGIGIPKALPTSTIWEKVYYKLSFLSIVEQKKDKQLLKAAVEVGRTSTNETDRGKGLQDLLEFIRQRRQGYLSILSLKGLFKFSMGEKRENIKSKGFKEGIPGTLIIWNVKL